MNKRQAYADLLADLSAAADVATLQQVCQHFATSQGVTNLVVGVLRRGDDGAMNVSGLVEALPLPLSIASLKRRHENYTPTILELLNGNGAYDSNAPPTQNFQSDYQRIWDDHRQFAHLQYFYTVPVVDQGATRGWAGYFADRDFAVPEAKVALQVLTQSAYERMVQLSVLPQTISPLTRRQTDALTYCASGKSDWEIGEILGISEATAHEHVETAKRRLGVRTRIQAVVLAMQRGWIKP